MTHIEALEQLATGVMGWNVYTEAYWRNLTKEQRQEKCASVVLIATEIGSLCFGQPAGWDDEWNPFTNPAQALELADAWPQNFSINNYKDMTVRDRYQALVWDKRNKRYTCQHEKLAAALTGAVCAAEGIEVKESHEHQRQSIEQGMGRRVERRCHRLAPAVLR